MREVKYRAYHKAEKKMCEISVINLEDKGAFLIGVNLLHDTVMGGGKFIIEAPTDGRFCYMNEFHLLQFTGLKDKNGKEIFEDDIVCTFYDEIVKDGHLVHERGYNIDKVIYHNGMFCTNKEDDFALGVWTDGECDLEVIGNVHENPELLK